MSDGPQSLDIPMFEALGRKVRAAAERDPALA